MTRPPAPFPFRYTVWIGAISHASLGIPGDQPLLVDDLTWDSLPFLSSRPSRVFPDTLAVPAPPFRLRGRGRPSGRRRSWERSNRGPAPAALLFIAAFRFRWRWRRRWSGEPAEDAAEPRDAGVLAVRLEAKPSGRGLAPQPPPLDRRNRGGRGGRKEVAR